MSHKDKHGIEYSDCSHTDTLLRFFPSLIPKFDGIYSRKNDIVLPTESFAESWTSANGIDIIVFRLETLIEHAINLWGEIKISKRDSSYSVNYTVKQVTYYIYSSSLVDVVAKSLISRYENTFTKEVTKFT